jgi:CRP/FNR family transcriptional regulator, cyclic AMP receptor protein
VAYRVVAVGWALLADLPADDVRELLTTARRRTFARGEVVFHENDPADSLHLIQSGRFAVRIRTALGDTSLLAIHGPGESFGELALLDPGSARSATVSALEAGETRAVYRDDFANLQKRYPGVTQILLRLLAEQLRRTNQRLLDAHYADADTRVRRRLRDLTDLYRTDDGPIVIPLTQEELAEMAGTSRATVNRVLREEQQRGNVQLHRGRTTIVERTSE